MKTCSNKVFLIFNTLGVGGAEKRLIGLWLYLRESLPDFKLVCAEQLYEALIKQSEFVELSRCKKDIIHISFTGNTKMDSALLKKFIAGHVKAGDKLHFITFYPLLLRKKKNVKYLLTYPGTGLNNVNSIGKFYYLASFLQSDKLDILDPGVAHWLKKIFPFKRNSIFRTSNSFVDTRKYMPQYPKKNWIVFLGRFIEKKGILNLIGSLPVIHQSLLNKGIKDHHFYILGYGPLENEVRTIVKAEAYSQIPVTIQVSHHPEKILADSKIFLSLNSENNYPSKSLLEGLSAGNIPVVTKVGTTEMIAPNTFSKYLPSDFIATHLADAVTEVLTLNDEEFANLSGAARNFVMEHFTIKQMADYYIEFYK